MTAVDLVIMSRYWKPLAINIPALQTEAFYVCCDQLHLFCWINSTTQDWDWLATPAAFSSNKLIQI